LTLDRQREGEENKLEEEMKWKGKWVIRTSKHAWLHQYLYNGRSWKLEVGRDVEWRLVAYSSHLRILFYS